MVGRPLTIAVVNGLCFFSFFFSFLFFADAVELRVRSTDDAESVVRNGLARLEGTDSGLLVVRLALSGADIGERASLARTVWFMFACSARGGVWIARIAGAARSSAGAQCCWRRGAAACGGRRARARGQQHSKDAFSVCFLSTHAS